MQHHPNASWSATPHPVDQPGVSAEVSEVAVALFRQEASVALAWPHRLAGWWGPCVFLFFVVSIGSDLLDVGIESVLRVAGFIPLGLFGVILVGGIWTNLFSRGMRTSVGVLPSPRSRVHALALVVAVLGLGSAFVGGHLGPDGLGVWLLMALQPLMIGAGLLVFLGTFLRMRADEAAAWGDGERARVAQLIIAAERVMAQARGDEASLMGLVMGPVRGSGIGEGTEQAQRESQIAAAYRSTRLASLRTWVPTLAVLWIVPRLVVPLLVLLIPLGVHGILDGNVSGGVTSIAGGLLAAIAIVVFMTPRLRIASRLRSFGRSLERGRSSSGPMALEAESEWLDRHGWGFTDVVFEAAWNGRHHVATGLLGGRPLLVSAARSGRPGHRTRSLTSIYLAQGGESRIDPGLEADLSRFGFVVTIRPFGIRLSSGDASPDAVARAIALAGHLATISTTSGWR